MGAAGENESEQQTEAASREKNIRTIAFFSYFGEAIMESGEAETLNRIQWRMPGAPKPYEMSKSQDNPKQSQLMNTSEVIASIGEQNTSM